MLLLISTLFDSYALQFNLQWIEGDRQIFNGISHRNLIKSILRMEICHFRSTWAQKMTYWKMPVLC